MTKESGVKSNIKPPAPPAAIQLDAGNFDDIVLDDTKDVLVSFTAPWVRWHVACARAITDFQCGHCKNMKPAFEEVARAFKAEPNCVVANMNADEAENRPVASKYGVQSFPTIMFFGKGTKEPVPYTSGRTAEDFTEVSLAVTSRRRDD